MPGDHNYLLDPDLTIIDPGAFVAPNAVVMGDVQIGAEASVWYHSVLRGDTAPLRVGARSNIQDGCIMHADPGYPCTVGRGVTVGHRCILHGANIEDGALIGMGAIVLNGAVIGEQALLGAGALVTEGKVIPPRVLALGSPARVIRDLREDEIANLERSARGYIDKGRAFVEAGLW